MHDVRVGLSELRGDRGRVSARCVGRWLAHAEGERQFVPEFTPLPRTRPAVEQGRRATACTAAVTEEDRKERGQAVPSSMGPGNRLCCVPAGPGGRAPVIGFPLSSSQWSRDHPQHHRKPAASEAACG